MSTYLEILAVQRPFPIGEDENARVMYSCNYDAVAHAPVQKLEEEVYRILNDVGLALVGPTGDTVFDRRTPRIGAGPFLNIIDTGGTRPDETHNGDVYERLSFQIIVRAADYRIARTRALAVWRALHGQRNVTVTAI